MSTYLYQSKIRKEKRKRRRRKRGRKKRRKSKRGKKNWIGRRKDRKNIGPKVSAC